MSHVWYITLVVSIYFVATGLTANCLCITEPSPDIKNACDNVSKEKCVVASSALSCMEKVENGIADLTIVQSEEAIFGAQLMPNNTAVVGYLKPLSEEGDANFNTIILINRKSIPKDLKGLKYCHLGNDVNIASPVLKEFENFIWGRNNINFCYDKSATAVENYFYNLNATFGSSCIPGKWSLGHLDVDLRNTFPKLLDLCDVYQDASNRFIQSLNCLISGRGDVALTSLEEFIPYKQKHNLSDEDFFYLCRNGELQYLNNTCVWSKHTWPLVIANKNIIDDIRITLRESFPEEVWDSSPRNHHAVKRHSPDFNDLLSKILFRNSRTLHLVANAKLTGYVESFRKPSIDTEETTCKRGLKWCTVTEQETKQCLLLQKIMQIYGIEPRIEACERLEGVHIDKYECVKNIMMNYSDITYIDSDQLYNARMNTNKVKLDVALYIKNKYEEVVRSVLIINSTTIKSKDDLKNKKACFSKFGSIDWLWFIDYVREEIGDYPCNYYERLSKFVNHSCVPGVALQDIHVITNHLCTLCQATIFSATKHNCNANKTENEHADNQGALNCLTNMEADYAVLKIEKDLVLPEGFMVMCKNGTLAETLEVDDDCVLGISPSGAIVVSESNIYKKAIQLAFKEIEAVALNPSTLPWNPFERYERIDCSLFGNSATGFYIPFVDINTPSYITKHINLIENVDKCKLRLAAGAPNDPSETDSSSSNGFLGGFFVIVGIGSILGAAVFGWFKVKPKLRGNINNNRQNNKDESEEGEEMVTINTNRRDEIEDNEERSPLKTQNNEESKNLRGTE